jgi:hypothetical protein
MTLIRTVRYDVINNEYLINFLDFPINIFREFSFFIYYLFSNFILSLI